MSKYTEGPWQNDDGFIFSEGCMIAEVGIDPQPIEEVEANAKLIAAAPDLFRELQLVLDYEEQSQFEQWLESKSPHGDCESVQSQWLESSEYEDFCDLWSGPIAAIAKALAQ